MRILFVLASVLLASVPTVAGGPTFEERVEAQRRLDAVYLAHQSGKPRSVDEALPQNVLEHKVQTYLKQSRLLEQRWDRPITRRMLESELQRMVRSTRMPERLHELFGALDHDPALIAECLARPLLVDRLARSLFTEDERRASASDDAQPRHWDAWWPAVAAEIAIADFEPHDRPVDLLPPLQGAASTPCLPDDTWDNGVLDIPDARTDHTAIWTGSQMIIWGGEQTFGQARHGARYDPATDTWSSISTVDAPTPTDGHTAVWTGDEMIVWGGWPGLDKGGRYDPLTDSWVSTTTVNAPEGRHEHTAVWTGEEMIVWGGGFTSSNTGGRYNPTTDSWQPTSQVGAPAQRDQHTAVWTGDRMIVWGGSQGAAIDTGGIYDPMTDSWTATAMVGAPEPRRDHTAVWAGDQMIVWAGDVPGPANDTTGGRYDPATDTWQSMSLMNVPSGRALHTAIWTGSEMVIWGGGFIGNFIYQDDAGRYDPDTDSWSPIATLGAPSARANHTAVWTGAEIIVWGGEAFSNVKDTGGRYDPTADTWTPTGLGNAPAARDEHTTVWTGNRMIIWGGGGNLSSGSRYDPATDSWQPTADLGAPDGRVGHTVVWADGEMIVWGGSCCSGKGAHDTGGRYDPLLDSWQPTSTLAVPIQRTAHSAVWTGSEMIVWGGILGPSIINDGARYRPATDTWSPMTTADAPSERFSHTAVWTGDRMVVWGGRTLASLPNTGAIYDPLSDNWTTITTVGAPSGRENYSAVWTGDELIIWGGQLNSNNKLDTGGRYDPTLDSWQPTSTLAAPAPRSFHTAVWTGNRMLVWSGFGTTPNLYPNDGGIYDAATDSWAETEVVNAPTPRLRHGAVWSGSFMIVWGGSGPLRSGGRYALGHADDDDGDGLSECDGDCADADAGVFDAPSSIVGLTITRSQFSNALLEWPSDAPNSGSGTTYDVLRGTLDDLPVFDAATCLRNDTAGTIAGDNEDPASGQGFYYLVRGQNVCATGSWGLSGDEAERQAASCP